MDWLSANGFEAVMNPSSQPASLAPTPERIPLTEGDSPPPQPTPPAERIEAIDVLRGFVVCAILLMNMELFTTSFRDISGGISPELQGASWWADALVYTLLHGKGWTLFSLLFGVGFAIMRRQAIAHGHNLTPLWLRRAGVLLVIGLLHAILVWQGDILVSYAFAAMALLLFRNATAQSAATWGAVLFAFPTQLMIATTLVSTGLTAQPAETTQTILEASRRAAEISALSSGSFGEATGARIAYLVDSLPAKVLFLPLIVGMALLGMALFDSGALTRPKQHLTLWRRLCVLGVGFGAAFTAASLALNPDPTFGPNAAPDAYLAAGLHLLGAPFLAIGYAATIILALQDARAGRWLARLAPTGRLALSNYLLQSIVCTTIFYGYGFGLWGELSRLEQCLLAVAILMAQVIISRGYTKRFHYGPAEWLWRWGIYGVQAAFGRDIHGAV